MVYANLAKRIKKHEVAQTQRDGPVTELFRKMPIESKSHKEEKIKTTIANFANVIVKIPNMATSSEPK